MVPQEEIVYFTSSRPVRLGGTYDVSNDAMYRGVFAMNIAVLEKCPNKPGVHKPRSIGSGASSDRKLGNACLVAAAYADMKKVMMEA